MSSPSNSYTSSNGSSKKKKRRRPKIQDVSKFANLTGIAGSTGSYGMDDCMAEMMMVQQPQEPQNEAPSKLDHQPPTRPPSWIDRPFKTRTDIHSWHRDFQTWAETGAYTQGLLPNVDQELTRNFKVKELSTLLLESGKDLRMPLFERWLIDSKYEEEHDDNDEDDDHIYYQKRKSGSRNSTDPVLPSRASPDSAASRRLLQELTFSNNKNKDCDGSGGHILSSEQAERVIAELCRNCNLACHELLSQEERYLKQSSLRKGDRIELERSQDTSSLSSSRNTTVTILYARKKWKKPFCFRLNATSLDRLRERFQKVHNRISNDGLSGNTSWHHPKYQDLVERSFLVLVVSLLLRYSAFSGGQLLDDLRGGGMQGAVHAQVFDVLQKHLSPSSPSTSSSTSQWLEGFASPFNASMDYFGSAFPDLDWHFGSVGNFLRCEFASKAGGTEYCEANPPFSPALMEGMAGHMIRRLQVAEDIAASLTFVVVVPTVTDRKKAIASSSQEDGDGNSAFMQQAASQSFEALLGSHFCTKHVCLRAREHGYVEGSQHLRPTQYKQSTYDTSVIVLQSPAASEKEASLEELEKDLRSAFASRHVVELQQRKKQKIGTL